MTSHHSTMPVLEKSVVASIVAAARYLSDLRRQLQSDDLSLDQLLEIRRELSIFAERIRVFEQLLDDAAGLLVLAAPDAAVHRGAFGQRR